MRDAGLEAAGDERVLHADEVEDLAVDHIDVRQQCADVSLVSQIHTTWRNSRLKPISDYDPTWVRRFAITGYVNP